MSKTIFSNLSDKTKELFELIKDMNLPRNRVNWLSLHNIRWLSANLAIKNSNHPNFLKAQSLILEILIFDSKL